MSANNGGPAFPQTQTATEREFVSGLDVGEGGMTLRDYFAAQSINAAVAKAIHNFKCDGVGHYSVDWDHIAESCYDAADAMLKAREA
jgi:hypothetical protein